MTLQVQSRDSLELASLASSSVAHDSPMSEVSSRQSISSSRRLSLVEEEDPLADGHAAHAAAGGGAGRLGRSYSVSSAFNFAGNLFPLSSSTGAGRYAPLGAPTSAARPGGGSLEKMKSLTYLNGLSLIVGLIIGSGIFSSPSQVIGKVGSTGAALVVWVVAGVLAWTGAASYAELGGAIPLNGGAQVYLSKTFGEMAGFLFSWVALLVLKPGSSAIIAIIMGEYFTRAFMGAEVQTIDPWINKGVALVAVAVVTFINCVSTRLSTRVNDMLMFLKFVALLGVTVIGVVVAVTGHSFKGEPSVEWKAHDWFRGTSYDPSNWAMALYGGLWAFDGWDNTNYVVGEFRNPGRELPRVIHTAMPLVILCYVLANIAYFFVLPTAVINSTNTVAVMFGAQVFGPAGSLVFALIVSASCFGALNSSTFTSSRLVYVAAKEGYIPAVFARIGLSAHAGPPADLPRPRACLVSRAARAWLADEDSGLFYTPIFALALNAALTAAYCVAGEFGTLLTFYGVAGYTFYFLTVLGLIVLRIREPDLERPYRTWITTPIIFSCVSLFLLSKALFAQPLQTLIVVSFVLAGIPVYFWRLRGREEPIARRRGPHAGSDPEKPWWRFW
ncbi:Y+L amino acid transporter 2 [Escovopsis weberi]|uniref:Y+L amino acid transporter 2 n=1 Tax=Escovopsis weberi TaxID=150374 RepID=A0A0M8MUD7_ESCWE|nr:Y+L amino acid transporter 2 [Escovopsis weberi]